SFWNPLGAWSAAKSWCSRLSAEGYSHMTVVLTCTSADYGESSKLPVRKNVSRRFVRSAINSPLFPQPESLRFGVANYAQFLDKDFCHVLGDRDSHDCGSCNLTRIFRRLHLTADVGEGSPCDGVFGRGGLSGRSVQRTQSFVRPFRTRL